MAKAFKKFGTYNTDNALSCWLYCEDGMTREDGEDYEEYIDNKILPG